MRSMVPSSSRTRRIIPLELELLGVDAAVKASSALPVNRRRHRHDAEGRRRRRRRVMVDVMVDVMQIYLFQNMFCDLILDVSFSRSLLSKPETCE
jgi:hypothetical protein